MQLDTHQVDIDSVHPHPQNVREGDVGAIAESLKHHEQYRAIVVSETTGNILAGNHTWKAAKALGWDTIAVHLLPDLDLDSELRILLMDNASAEKATYDVAGLAELLTDLAASEKQLAGTGWDGDDLDELLSDLERSSFDNDTAAKRIAGKKWLADIDLYYTLGTYKGVARDDSIEPEQGEMYGHTTLVTCCVAVKSGWRYGAQSSMASCGAGRFWPRHKPDFIDNEFKDYDHDQHLRFVNYWKPKYATVRDVMTKAQCEEAGIDYYTLDEVLEMATEVLDAGAQNVIVIPKVDCIDDIPDIYTLGFSVPTSYGGTPLPLERFKGRNIHLLGGSPGLQISYVEALGEDVVSLDSNYMNLTAQFGSFWTPGEPQRSLTDIGFEPDVLSNPLYVAFCLSMGHFARFFQHQADSDELAGGVRDADA